jgi:hypothetical protein
MTRPPQPTPYPGDPLTFSAGGVRWRKEYRDERGRPMSGTVAITSATAPSPAPEAGLARVVELVDGVLEADLPRGVYRFAADLRTADGERVEDEAVFSLL